MKNQLVRLTIVLLAVCSLSIKPAFAQTTSGQIAGTVVDQSGKPIPGADVTLTNQLTSEVRTEKTEASGAFLFLDLQPGTFMVSVTATGFKTLTKRDLTLSASERLSAGTLQMAIGTVNENVTVRAEATPVQTDSSERSALLDSHQMSTLLDPSLNFMNITRVVPGTVATNHVGADELGMYGVDAVNGVRPEYTSVSSDGVYTNTNAGRIDRVLTAPNTNSIAEVKVLSNNYQAEYGGTSGSQINTVTKSGTRDFHGTVYYYHRHEDLNAIDFFDALNGHPKAINRFHTFGFNVGGPVWVPGLNFNRSRSKLFFFFSFENWPTAHPGDADPYEATMPTALERAGDFTQSIWTNCGKGIVTCPVSLTDPMNCGAMQNQACLISPNKINPAFINPNTKILLGLLPAPNITVGSDSNCSDTCNYFLHETEHNPVRQEILRLDWNISDKWRAYFRGMDEHIRSYGDANATPILALANTTFPTEYDNRTPNVSVDLTYIASPTLVNELNIGYAQWNEDQIFPMGLGGVQKSKLGINLGQFNAQDNPLGLIPGLIFVDGNQDNVVSSIGFTSGTSRFPIHAQSYSYGISDGLSKVWGAHNSKVGINYHLDRYVNNNLSGDFAGMYNFSSNLSSGNTPFDSGNTFANALLGNFLSYSETKGDVQSDPITRVLEWYIQDSWKVRRNFTLDYGLRFTWDLPQTLKTGANFVPSAYDPTKAPVLYVHAIVGGTPAVVDPRNPTVALPPSQSYLFGAVVPGSGNPFDGMVPITNADVTKGQGLLVAPRLGFAWDIFGNGRTVLRGGSGIFYNARLDNALAGNLATLPPNQSTPINPFGNVSQLNFSAGNAAGALFPTNSRGLELNGERPVFYNSSLGIQTRVGFQTVVDVAYVSTLGRDLGLTMDLNSLAPGTDFLASSIDPTTGMPYLPNFLRPHLGLGSIPWTFFGGSSNYNALQVSVTRRFARGLSFGANYTWSKTMDIGGTDNASTSGDNSTSGGATISPFIPIRDDYGLASFDRDKNLRINWLWDLPRASRLWDNVVIREAFDNWELSGIATFVTGIPQSISLNTSSVASTAGGSDRTGGSDAPRAVITGNATLSSNARTFSQWFNTSVVSLPPVNTIGSNGQYALLTGNAGRSVFRGPGTNNWNMAFAKNIIVKEKVTIQLRAEFFNIFNHPSFTALNTTAKFDKNGNLLTGSKTTFGRLTSTTNGNELGPIAARQIQLTARVSF